MGFILSVVNYLSGHVETSISVVVALMALAAAMKCIPAFLEKKAMDAIDYVFTNGDAADKEWFVATLKYAEAKYGPGTGAQKAKFVVDKIIGLLPMRWRLVATDAVKAKAYSLFQASFDKLEAVTLKEIEEHKNVGI